MSSAKHSNRHYTQVAVEASYGSQTTALPTVDTSASFHTHEPPEVTGAYQFDGALEGEGSPGGSTRPNIGTSGRNGSVSLVHRFRRPTAAYAATVLPEVFRAARGHGLSATFNATGGSAAGPLWTLAPQRTAHTSVAVDAYLHGELEHLYGVYFGGLEIAFAAGKVPVWTLSGQGIRSLPIDSAVPALDYVAANRDYAKFITTGATLPAMSINVGGTAVHLNVREGTWKSERPVEERLTSAVQTEAGLGHPGFSLGNEVATFEGVVEATTRTGITAFPYSTATAFEPTRLYEAGSSFNCTIRAGTEAGGFRIVGGAACFTEDATRDVAGNIALWNVKIRFNANQDTAADAYFITAGA